MKTPIDMTEGSVHESTLGAIRVIKYVTSKNVRAMLEETGEMIRASAESIRSGKLSSKSKSPHKTKYKNGTVLESNCCGKFKILNYVNFNHIEVYFFDTKTKAKTTGQAIGRGSVRDPSLRPRKSFYTGKDEGVLS